MKVLFKIFLFLIFSNSLFSQNDIKTEKIKVNGNCVMCKKRIESALVMKGVTNAIWDLDTKELTINYMPSKTNLTKIRKRIAKIGHDNEEFKADAKTYDKLHACCKYERE
jgi:copper chaperone CopZ